MPITINDCATCGSVPVVYTSNSGKWVMDCIIPDCNYGGVRDGKSFTDARSRWNELNPSNSMGMEAKDADDE